MSHQKSRRRARLHLECLEQRTVPAAPVFPLNNFANQGFTLRGFEDGAEAGQSVAGAGDINGDGFADVIVGADQANAGGSERGEVYVIFGGGSLGGTAPTLNALGFGGFTLRGFEDSASLGRSTAGAGDVNGDGFGDIIIGAQFADAGGGPSANRGEAYVVFGGPNRAGTTVSLNALGNGGFTVRGFQAQMHAGSSVSGAGDVNGDGFADVVIGAPNANAGGSYRGEAYVVFGGPNRAGTTVLLNALGAGGFTLRGFENSASAGWSVAGAGDFNGDGFPDVIVGAPFAGSGGNARGEAYVVFGGNHVAGSTITLNAQGSSLFTLKNGSQDQAAAGGSVAGAGDVNGDGFADVLVGAEGMNVTGTGRGEAYVVFGGANRPGNSVFLSDLGTAGFTLRGFEDSANAGGSVAGAGDVNGDGFTDVLVGATGTEAGGTNRGEVYVVFGGSHRAGTTVFLNALGNGGFTLRGFENSGSAGESVAGAGDVNGDGFADVLVGADEINAGGNNRGEAYVIFAPLPNVYAVGSDAGTPAKVVVLNATTHRPRAELYPFGQGFTGGARVATADLNRDGALDIIVGGGPGPAQNIKVYDGRTLAVIREFSPFGSNFTGGVFVAGGDVNNDGAADVIVAAGPGGGPHVRVISGATGADLHSFFAFASTFTGGANVAAGDVNADGFGDLIVAAGPTGGPHVRALSGINLSELLGFFAFEPTMTRGLFVSAGDLDGNGRPDIVIGAGSGGSPHVKVFSHTGALEHSYFAFAPTFTGGVRVGVTDVDGDGRREIVTAAGPGGGPHVRVRRGSDLVELASYFAFDPGFTGGVFVG